MQSCPQCFALLESPLACAACAALEPLGVGSSRACTPFEILGLPLAFRVDGATLRKSLLRLARLVHPDFHGAHGPEARARAEEVSARLNGAYDILASDSARADWLLMHLGGPDEATERSMPKSFLLEVLEWNELLEEAHGADSNTGAGAGSIARATALASTLAAARRAAFERLDQLLAPLPARASAALTTARAELNAVRYIDRALGEIRALELARATTRS